MDTGGGVSAFGGGVGNGRTAGGGAGTRGGGGSAVKGAVMGRAASGGSSAGSASTSCRMFAAASNTSEQCPHRTQRSEIFSWSGTTLNRVPHEGHPVIMLMGRGL